MLIRTVSVDTLALAQRLSEEVAARLAAARGAEFANEAAAEACLWQVVALMQQQAAVTARILNAAIDVKNAARARNEETS